jgi:hypothetical protein
MVKDNTGILRAAARGWHPYPKPSRKSLASRIEQAADECRALTYRLEGLAERARTEQFCKSKRKEN